MIMDKRESKTEDLPEVQEDSEICSQCLLAKVKSPLVPEKESQN